MLLVVPDCSDLWTFIKLEIAGKHFQLWFCLLSYQCHHTALIVIVAYTCVAWQYQYQERDEPDNIYRYAEDYHANAQDEPNYDYDDHDNLDVHTINNNN